jgi:hypothetical protein
VAQIIELAMSIEAQALDLYLRASEKAKNEAGKKALIQTCNDQLMEETQLRKPPDIGVTLRPSTRSIRNTPRSSGLASLDLELRMQK